MKGKVMVVEDEIIVADDLAWQLTMMGYDVLGTAASGEEAIASLKKQRADIVLMDIQLQGHMTGIEAAENIQRETGAAVIFITAFPAALVRSPDTMRPPDVCLSKPISIVQLRAALDSVATAQRRS